MYFHEPEGATASAREAPLSLVLPTWILISVSVYFGIDASFTAGASLDAAAALLGGAR